MQTAQIKRIKEHFFPEIDYKDIKQTYIPMPREWSLEASEKSPPSNVNEYLSHIGVTMYMLKTRLEIATSISLLSGQGKSPSELDVHAIFHLASYLLTTATVGLTLYPGSSGMDSMISYLGFADAAFDVHQDSKFRYGWLIKQGESEGGSIIAKSKKETGPPSDSACTSEVRSLCELIKDIVVIRGIAEELGYRQDQSTIVGEDNQAVCQLTRGLNGKGKRIRHIIRYIHFATAYVESKIIELRQVKSIDQEANVLTKILPSAREHWREAKRLLGKSKEISLIQAIVAGGNKKCNVIAEANMVVINEMANNPGEELEQFINKIMSKVQGTNDDNYIRGIMTVVNTYINESQQDESWRESIILNK